MPEICRFYGIIILMFWDDHNPPHLHVKYGDYRAIITLDQPAIQGYLPIRVAKMVFEWLSLHESELKNNWEKLVNGEQPNKIEPLK